MRLNHYIVTYQLEDSTGTITIEKTAYFVSGECDLNTQIHYYTENGRLRGFKSIQILQKIEVVEGKEIGI